MGRRSDDDKTMWILGAVLVIGLVGTAIGVAKMFGYDPGRPRDAMVGQAAPPIDLPLVAGDGAGDRVSLASLEGRVVLLDFWASWCGPCRASIPRLNVVHEHFGDRIAMYGVNVDNALTPDRIRAAHRSFGAGFPSLSDARLETQSAYGIRSIPTLVLIDQSGVVRWVERGMPDEDEVIEQVEALLQAP